MFFKSDDKNFQIKRKGAFNSKVVCLNLYTLFLVETLQKTAKFLQKVAYSTDFNYIITSSLPKHARKLLENECLNKSAFL